MSKKELELSKTLLNYGKTLTDVNIKDSSNNFIRIRTFKYYNNIYYHQMMNGEVAYCFILE